MNRATWIEINLDNLKYNFLQIKKILSPRTKIMAIVKKDAYGHGMVKVAKILSSLGADYFGVASVDEALRLKAEKINLPILILGNVLEDNLNNLNNYDFAFSISEFGLARYLNNIAKRNKKKIKVHIKIDTGMSRLGVLYNEAVDFIRRVYEFKNLFIEGIFTHFACADKDREFTLLQIKRFKEVIAELQRYSINIPLSHCANSLATLNFPESHFNMVRPGIILYGLYPQERLSIKLKPVLSLKAKLVLTKKIPSQWGVSYGHIYRLKRDSYIGVLPVGYGDGYFRNLSNKAEVLIRGRRFRIAGIICMDMMMVDLKDNYFKKGEEVTLIGREGKECIRVEELAKISNTIPYEITCSLGSHLPRTYLGDI